LNAIYRDGSKQAGIKSFWNIQGKDEIVKSIQTGGIRDASFEICFGVRERKYTIGSVGDCRVRFTSYSLGKQRSIQAQHSQGRKYNFFHNTSFGKVFLRFVWITACKIGISDEKGNFLGDKAKTRQSTLKVKKNCILSPFT
jgi:hypothetical protein